MQKQHENFLKKVRALVAMLNKVPTKSEQENDQILSKPENQQDQVIQQLKINNPPRKKKINFVLSKFKFIYAITSKRKTIESKISRNYLTTAKRLYEYNFTKKVLIALARKRKLYQKMTITINQNNIFCTFIDLKAKKTLHTGSSGIYQLKISKRKLKHYYIDFLKSFFARIKESYGTLQNTCIELIAPIRLRRKMLRIIKTQISESGNIEKIKDIPYNVIINIVPKKCFNGCTPRKKISKKRLLYTIYK